MPSFSVSYLLNIFILSVLYAECHYAECCYTFCRRARKEVNLKRRHQLADLRNLSEYLVRFFFGVAALSAPDSGSGLLDPFDARNPAFPAPEVEFVVAEFLPVVGDRKKYFLNIIKYYFSLPLTVGSSKLVCLSFKKATSLLREGAPENSSTREGSSLTFKY